MGQLHQLKSHPCRDLDLPLEVLLLDGQLAEINVIVSRVRRLVDHTIQQIERLAAQLEFQPLCEHEILGHRRLTVTLSICRSQATGVEIRWDSPKTLSVAQFHRRHSSSSKY